MNVKRARRAALAIAVAASLGTGGDALAASFFDVQANFPQVAGDLSSDATAVFPTNKQNETTIAVNPIDRDTAAPGARHLIAGANDEQQQPACGAPERDPGGDPDPADCSFFPGVGADGVYTSSDGGATWVNRGLLDDQPSWQSSPYISDGDPVIVYGPKPAGGGAFSYDDGARAYYVGLGSYKEGSSPFPPQKAPELIIVSYSDDDGLTWSAPVAATTKRNPNTFNDKNSAWADQNPDSPYFGRLYVGFTAFRSATVNGNGNEPIQVSYSADGANSFSAPRQLSPAGNNSTGNGRQGSDIVSGPDGSVYVAFEQGSAQVVAISRNGGVTYSRPRTIGPVVDIEDPIPGANFRTDSFPNIAADQRARSTAIYTSWTTRMPNGGRTVLYRSTNRGQSWSLLTTVSSAAQGYAFFDALDVAPNGRVDVGFQALKADDPTTFGTGNARIDSFYANSTTGYTPVKVTSVSSDPAASAQNNLQRQFWGDYNTLESANDRVWFIYTDSRHGVGCPEVDEYQTILAAEGIAEDEEREGPAADPDSHEDGEKPAPPEHCASQFGNTDAFVSVVTP